MRFLLFGGFYFGKMWKILEKRPFFRADTAGLGKYCTGGYGRIGVYRVNQEICRQKTNLYAILWKSLTFMKFCRDYYGIHENKKIFISNASWEILNRTFFNRISKYNGS